MNRAVLTGIVALLCGACSDVVDRLPPLESIICTPNTRGCVGSVAGTCNARGTAWEDTVTCEGHTPLCVAEVGCVACEPGDRRCQGNDVVACTADGAGWATAERCQGESLCWEGRCDADCALAGISRSYLGCEYAAVTLMNSQLASDFQPAIVLGNGNDEPATVTVESWEGGFSEEVVIDPDSSSVVMVPWDLDLKNGGGTGRSANLAGAAFRVASSLPVTAYQFNPLEYSLDHDCRVGDVMPGDGVCYSYSNDASLLLPVPALTQHYLVMSRPNLGIRYGVVGSSEEAFHFSPSVLAVVNPQETTVSVEVTLTAPVAAGRNVEAFEAGDVATFELEPGGVLQLAARSPTSCEPDSTDPEPTPCAAGECTFGYCDLQELDLTGTEISASAAVAVYGAHDCDFIPYDRWACDHLEEQLFPYETLGRRFVVSQAHRENGEPDVWRVLSGVDGNTVRFDPPDVHDEVELDRGEHVEFEAGGAFVIDADGPIMVGQFLVGQNYNTVPSEQELPPGDPAFALAVPAEQWRSSYNFLAPGTYDRSFVNITAHKDFFQSIALDGESLELESWEMVGTTEYVTLRLEIEPGPHSLRSGVSEDQEEQGAFGVLVYGFGQYTSYMVPGGLDLEVIAPW
jgi:hypothetical protein